MYRQVVMSAWVLWLLVMTNVMVVVSLACRAIATVQDWVYWRRHPVTKDRLDAIDDYMEPDPHAYAWRDYPL